MKVLNPVAFTDANLVSHTIAEPDSGETAWVSAGTYALNDLRIRSTTHRVYKCIQAHTGRTALPEVDTAYWSDNAPTNRWAAFDNVVSTASIKATSQSFVFKPGNVDSIAFMGLIGAQLVVTQKDATGGSVIYTNTIALTGPIIYDWLEYFFSTFTVIDSVVLANVLLPYYNCEITVTLTGANTAIGVVAAGWAIDLGGAQYQASASIMDYSTKFTDANGVTTIVKRPYSRRMELTTWLTSAQFNTVYALLASLRSTPVFWAGVDDSTYTPFNIFGYYKDFRMQIAYPTVSLCTFSIEGLI